MQDQIITGITLSTNVSGLITICNLHSENRIWANEGFLFLKVELSFWVTTWMKILFYSKPQTNIQTRKTENWRKIALVLLLESALKLGGFKILYILLSFLLEHIQ